MAINKSIIRWLVIALIWAYPTGHAQAQVTLNVLRRVLMIRVGTKAGTGFTLDVDGRQYLVTARHLVASLKSDDTIEVRKGDLWTTLKVKVLLCEKPIDIAVLIPPSQLTVNFAFEPNTSKLLFGQDAYFTGFPYGLSTGGTNVNGLYPLAFLKKGTISAKAIEDGAVVFFLDGHNNPGFSGGPIVYRDLNQSGTPVFYVAAVVSGYRPEYEPILQPQELKTGEIATPEDEERIVTRADGRKVKLVETGQVVRLNTGIVRGYDIKYAVELIRKNPTGPKAVETFTQ